MDYVRCADLKGRFIGYGLPVPWAKELQAEVIKWERNSGPRWTVERLKSLKSDIIRLQSGQETSTWVAKNRRGEWKGIWGSLKRFSLKNLSSFEIVLNCLMCYSSFIPSKPDGKHIDKMHSSIQARDIFIPPDLDQSIADHARKTLGCLSLGSSRPLLTFQGRVSTKAPVLGGPSVPQYQNLEKELDWFIPDSHLDFSERHWQCYSPVLEGLNWTTLSKLRLTLPLCEEGTIFWGSNPLRPKFQPVLAGHLVPLTKDGGWKVRWIASPYRIHQAALNPLGEALYGLLRKLPWDCTFEQHKAQDLIQEHLRKGRHAFAVDLSSATDYFPLSLQLSVLKALFPRGAHQIELFSELSRSEWKYGNQKLSWKKGQPMGLYPSFASFSLTHGVLLDMLSNGKPAQFFVLGDDVVILDQSLYERYLRILDLLECPHDPIKTISSDQLTEFAGKIITPERVVSSYKWRDPNSKNFLELMRTFGQSFEPLLRPRERSVYRRIARLLPPWGCNHTLGKAEPLERVVALTEEFKDLLPEASGRAVHTSFLHKLFQVLQPEKSLRLFSGIRWGWFQKMAADLDERSVRAFKNTPFQGFPGDPGPMADVLEALNVLIDLPPVGPKERVDQSDLLEFYEKILGLARPSQ